MLSSKVIGGEFGIDIQNLGCSESTNGFLNGVYKYASGRSALYYILCDIQKRYGITTIYLPDYLCSSIVIAAQKIRMNIIFYNLNSELEIDAEKFPMQTHEKAAILLINYFGLKNLKSQIEFVRRINENVILIEDDVQAFYEFQEKDLNTHYKFTSLRKTFACPDGGLVKTENELEIISDANKFHQYKLAGSVLKELQRLKFSDDVYLQLFEKGESCIDDEMASGMSLISQELFKNIDLERIAYIRQCNAQQILNGLKNLGIQTILPVRSDKIPLFIPVWLEDRNKVRKQMFEHRIFCPVHWPLEGVNVQKGAEMAEHEMSIIIDQRYTQEDMDIILDILEKALK